MSKLHRFAFGEISGDFKEMILQAAKSMKQAAQKQLRMEEANAIDSFMSVPGHDRMFSREEVRSVVSPRRGTEPTDDDTPDIFGGKFDSDRFDIQEIPGEE